MSIRSDPTSNIDQSGTGKNDRKILCGFSGTTVLFSGFFQVLDDLPSCAQDHAAKISRNNRRAFTIVFEMSSKTTFVFLIVFPGPLQVFDALISLNGLRSSFQLLRDKRPAVSRLLVLASRSTW